MARPHWRDADPYMSFTERGPVRDLLGLDTVTTLSQAHPDDRVLVYVELKQGDQQVIVGAAAALLEQESPTPGVVDCFVLGVSVKPDCQGKRLGVGLLHNLHELAFTRAQYIAVLKGNGAAQILRFQVARATCYMSVRALLMHRACGHTILRTSTQAFERGELVLGEEELCEQEPCSQEQIRSLVYKAHRFEIKPLLVPLRQPYHSHRFEPPAQLFAPLDQLPPEPPATDKRWVDHYKVNDAVRNGILPLSKIGKDGQPLFALTNYGLVPTVFPVKACRDLDMFLANPVNHVSGYDESYGTTHYVVAGDARLDGYVCYHHVNDTYISSFQRSRTAAAKNKKEIKACFLHVDGVLDLGRHALVALGVDAQTLTLERVLSFTTNVHFLEADWTSSTSFSWHTDDYDLDQNKNTASVRMVSAIIQLGCDSKTAMQVHGCRPYIYPGRGAGVLFLGAQVHRSLMWSPDISRTLKVRKVAFFFSLPFNGDSSRPAKRSR